MPNVKKSKVRDTPNKTYHGIVYNIYAHRDCRATTASSGMVARLVSSCTVASISCGVESPAVYPLKETPQPLQKLASAELSIPHLEHFITTSKPLMGFLTVDSPLANYSLGWVGTYPYAITRK